MPNNISPNISQAINKWSSDFFQFMLPSGILEKSTNVTQTEESAKLISSTLLYGERKGNLGDKPYNSSGVSNKIEGLLNESLWIYGKLNHPEGFTTLQEMGFHISTGKTYKCSKCKGRGLTVCSNCNGKGWKKDSEGNIKDCGWCSGGTNECSRCRGYGMLEEIINVDSKYKLATHHIENYRGDVPKTELEKVSGVVLFDETIKYPSNLQDMLVGGIDKNDYEKLQNEIKILFHQKIDAKLESYNGDKKLVHDLVDEFFKKMPNPATANQVLKYEIYPVRLRVKIEDAPVYQVDYTYKNKLYSLWVYGKEEEIYAPEKPNEFTWKLAILISLIVGFIALAVFNYLS